MDQLGINLSILIGPTVPAPAPGLLAETLQSVSVTHTDKDRSGFQITFQVGRSRTSDMMEHPLLLSPLIRPFNRVVLVVTFSGTPHVLMDGIITHFELSPGSDGSGSTFTLTGEDLSVVMDKEEKIADHPGQSEYMIVMMILGSYARYGIAPMAIPPVSAEIPLNIERVPQQHGTDLGFLKELALRFGYVFYISPGPVPGMSTAYWGPPVRSGRPQKPLSVNMGPSSNVQTISFQDTWLGPTLVTGTVQDRTSNQESPVDTRSSTREPLASESGLNINPDFVKKVLFHESGLSAAQASARAQGITDASVDEVVTATGTLDAVRYGDLLQPRGLVGLRGTGSRHDGVYYVRSVTHTIKKGEYRQQFTLTREGIGAISPVV